MNIVKLFNVDMMLFQFCIWIEIKISLNLRPVHFEIPEKTFQGKKRKKIMSLYLAPTRQKERNFDKFFLFFIELPSFDCYLFRLFFSPASWKQILNSRRKWWWWKAMDLDRRWIEISIFTDAQSRGLMIVKSGF